MVLNGVSLQPLPVLSGVLPGSVFGSLLFLLYINDICDAGISNGSKLVLYADNILLYQAVHSPDDHTLVPHDVNTLAAWSLIQLIWTVFISRRWSRKTEQSPLFLNGSLIEAVDCIKYLRISIASDLSCTQHIQSITSKARRLVGLLFQHQPSQSSICTTQVVLNASVAYLATHLALAVRTPLEVKQKVLSEWFSCLKFLPILKKQKRLNAGEIE